MLLWNKIHWDDKNGHFPKGLLYPACLILVWLGHVWKVIKFKSAVRAQQPASGDVSYSVSLFGRIGLYFEADSTRSCLEYNLDGLVGSFCSEQSWVRATGVLGDKKESQHTLESPLSLFNTRWKPSCKSALSLCLEYDVCILCPGNLARFYLQVVWMIVLSSWPC